MRVHEYTPSYPDPLAPKWLRHICVHCKDASKLSPWRIMELSKEEAECHNGREISLWENITGWLYEKYNCLQR